MKNSGHHRLLLLVFMLKSLVQAASFVTDSSVSRQSGTSVHHPRQHRPPGDSSEEEPDTQGNAQGSYSDPLDAHANLNCNRGTCKHRCWDPDRPKKQISKISARGKRSLTLNSSTTLWSFDEESKIGDDMEDLDLKRNNVSKNTGILRSDGSVTPALSNEGGIAKSDQYEDKEENFKLRTTFDAECHCDESCIIFGDCCYDFFSLCLQTNLTELLSSVQDTSGMSQIMQNITKTTNTTEESVLMYLYKHCEKIHNIEGTQHYWMVSQCPKLNAEETLDDAGNDIVSKCHDTSLEPLGSVPASLREQPDIVFRNIFCAQCNSVDKDKVIMWPSKASCSGYYSPSGITYDEFINKFRTSKCSVESKVPANTQPRPCERDRDTHLSLCPTHSSDGAFPSLDSLMCRSYVYPVVTDKGVKVRNSHCSTCSIKDTFWSFTCDPVTQFRFHDVEMPLCDKHSCKGQCNVEIPDQECHCDIRCLTYGDCCYDFISICLGNNFTLPDYADNDTLINTLLMQSVEQEPQNRGRTDGFEQTRNQISTTVTMLQGLYIRYRRCVHVPRRHLIWAIAKCPQNNEDPLCESATSFTNRSIFTPASYKHDVNIVFKNIYCGQCHGVPEEMLVQWDASISCSPTSQPFTNVKAFLSEHCVVNVEKMGGRACMEVDFDHENQADNDSVVVSLCGSYRYIVYSSIHSTQFRNPHCAYDIHGEKNVSCTVKTRKEESLKDEDDSARKGSELGGFSVLFNFNDKDVQFESTDGKVICKSNEVYDVYEKICRRIRCQEGKEAVNGTCVVSGFVYADRDNQLFPNGTLHYTVSVYVLTRRPLQINNIEDSLMVLSFFEQADVTDDDIEILNVSALPGDTYSGGIKWESGQDLKEVKIRLENVEFLADDIHAISELAQHLPSGSDPMIVDIILQNFHSESDLFCSYGAVMHLPNVTLETLNGTLYAVDSYKYYTLESVAFVLGLKRAPPDLQEIFVCGIPLKCDPVVYNLTDFIQEDGNLRNLYSGVILANTSFFIAGDEVLSCHNFTQSGPPRYSQIFFKYDHLQDILTYVTSGVSMVSLLITLVVYSLLPELRNLPGRLTMSLSATLLVAQTLLLLIHLPRGLLCQALAITLHFSWLCSFMWMTVLSITLARTFTSKGVNSVNQDTARTYGVLSLCAIGIPSIIVTTTALLDFLEVPNIYIGYGAQGICWIANPRASLLVFGVPLALMLLVNIVAFIMTLCNIEKSLKLSENITSSKKDKAKVFIYGKLFVIMGVSWCTSFGAAFADVNILWYMFIILNGLQGFYIFVSFVCTDRVKRLLRKKFTGSSADMRTTSTVTSTTETKSQKSEKNNI